VPLAGQGLGPPSLRQRASRPQLKRDPLGTGMYRIARFSLVALVVADACRPPRSAITPQMIPIPRYVLDSGALVRIRLHSRKVTGRLLASFTDSSRLLILGEQGSHSDTLDGSSPLTLAVDSIRALHVRGNAAGFGAYEGFYLGFLTALEISKDKNGSTLLVLSGFAGGALGSLVGSRVAAWVPVFPCAHACAGGVYHAN